MNYNIFDFTGLKGVECWKADHSELLLLGAKILVQGEKEKN